MRDPWTCRCGHEFTFTGIGTRTCVQVPHECLYDVTDYEPEDDDEPVDDCLNCGVCEWCIDRSIMYAEEGQ